jgi:2-desacetyl-2-hydroxyethyl bacteriochlorophyllide A dehydrogenase
MQAITSHQSFRNLEVLNLLYNTNRSQVQSTANMVTPKAETVSSICLHVWPPKGTGIRHRATHLSYLTRTLASDTKIEPYPLALIEPLAIAVHCCKLAGDMQGKSVTVFGAGPVGQLCGSVARAFGAGTVLVADIVASRLDFALQKGATHVYEMQKTSCQENAAQLPESSGQSGSDIVVDATGAQPCIETGIEVLKRGGVFVQAGLGQPKITFPVGLICDKEAVFRGSFRYGPGDYKLAIALVASGRVNLDGFVTRIFSFGEAQEAFETVLQKHGIKSVICGPGRYCRRTMVLGDTSV